MQLQPDSPTPAGMSILGSVSVGSSTISELRARQPWPEDLLEAFCLRMAGQGMCVSRVLMQQDRRYGLEQLTHAHNMADDRLREMAVQLFQCFVARQSGIPSNH